MLGIYTRLSKEDDQNNSIKNQIREGKEFAVKEAFTYAIYDEGEGVSGTLGIKDRPVLNTLTKDIIDGTINSVWVRNQNRLERDSLTYHQFIKIAQKHNTRLFFGGKEMDLSDPSQLLQNSLMSLINQYKTDLQSHQTRKSLLDNVKEGRANGRILPYGYKSNENGMLVIDMEEAKIVEKIYSMSLEGKGQKTIANWLNDNKILTRYNKIQGTLTKVNKYTKKKSLIAKKDIKWADKTSHDIIKNPIYKGERRWKGKTYDAPPIMTEDYWDKVNKNLKKNKNNTGKNVEHKYLLKGLLRCAKCGRNYYGRSRTTDPIGYAIRTSKIGKIRKDYNLYTCASKRYKHTNCGSKDIKLIELDALIWGVLFQEKELIASIKSFLSNTDVVQKEKETSNSINLLKLELLDLNKKKSIAINLVLDGILTNDDLKSKMNSIKSQINTSEEKLKHKTEYLNSLKSSEDLLSKNIESLEKIKHTLGFEDRRNIIHKYIDEIVLFTNHKNDPTNMFTQINIYYKNDLLVTDKFLFDLKHGIALNVFNKKVISLNIPIDEEALLTKLKPVFKIYEN